MIKIGKAGAVALAIWLFVLACFSGLIIFFGLFPDIIFSVSDEPLKALAEHVQQVILMHK